LDVYEAVTGRRAVRAFTDQPVPHEVLQRVLSAAAWSPSGVEPSTVAHLRGHRRAAGAAQEARRRTRGRRRPVGRVGVRDVPAIANWDCFGAPTALFCYIDRDLGLPQWADLGMYLQSVMLLLRAEGLHSCPQMSWAKVRKTVAEFVTPPDELVLFCGMSIGYEDVTVSHPRTGRASLDETVTFVEG
jgi:nitroreductase